MKIKKNGVTINLTESDIKKLSKRILREQIDGNKASKSIQEIQKYINYLQEFVDINSAPDRDSWGILANDNEDGYPIRVEWVMSNLNDEYNNYKNILARSPE